MPNKESLGVFLINNKNKKINPEIIKEIKENLDKIQVSLDKEQKNNKIRTPKASGKTMGQSYG